MSASTSLNTLIGFPTSLSQRATVALEGRAVTGQPSQATAFRPWPGVHSTVYAECGSSHTCVANRSWPITPAPAHPEARRLLQKAHTDPRETTGPETTAPSRVGAPSLLPGSQKASLFRKELNSFASPCALYFSKHLCHLAPTQPKQQATEEELSETSPTTCLLLALAMTLTIPIIARQHLPPTMFDFPDKPSLIYSFSFQCSPLPPSFMI